MPEPERSAESITRDEAVKLITDASWKRDGTGEDLVHTFRVGGPVLLGADNTLASVLEDLANADPDSIEVGQSLVGRVVQFYVQPGDQHRVVNV